MNGVWVSGDIPRLDGRKPSCGTPAATRLVSLGLPASPHHPSNSESSERSIHLDPEIRNENGVFMKIVLIGANGKIGELVQKALAGAGHEIVKVGRQSGDFRVEIENRESVRKLYQAVGSFDAVAIAAGEVAFAPLSELTAEKWQFSLGSKLMGQINLVQEAITFINEKGSFTLVSGVLNEEPIFAGVAGATVSGALEGFVRATAIELPKRLRINVVNPTILKESEAHMGSFFPGVIPVEGWKVAQAYKRAILGAQTGRVYKVD